jgi:hypothetical protein
MGVFDYEASSEEYRKRLAEREAEERRVRERRRSGSGAVFDQAAEPAEPDQP